MTTLRHDLVYTFRTLRKNPAFTAIALLTLALGIGANTAILSVADATLLRAPAVEEPDRLVALWTTCRRGEPRCSSSYPDFLDYRDRSRTMSDVAAYTWRRSNLGGENDSRLVLKQASSGNYFDLLGVRPGLGRLLQETDDRGESGQVVVLSDALWRDQFAADPEIVGRAVRLNGSAFTVVGVAPPGFDGLHIDGGPDVYVPLAPSEILGLDPGRFERRGSRWIAQLVGRLEDGAGVEAARDEMLAISDQLAAEDPESRGPRSVTLEAIPGHIRPIGSEDALLRFVLLLIGVVGTTLLLASANLANLLLARASERRREIATRLAIGAGQGRLLRQLLTESLTLASLGGLAGLLVAQWMLELFASSELPGGVRIDMLALHLDHRMLATAIGLSLLTGLLFGLVPAWQSASSDVMTWLKGNDKLERPGTRRLRHALVTVQVALCLVLLVGAGLFLRTLQNGLASDLGFRPHNVALARFDLRLLHYPVDRAVAFARELGERVNVLPGVETATVASLAPLGSGFSGTFVTVDGYEPAPDEEMRVDYLFVDDAYFRTLGIPFVRGRAFTSASGPSSTPVAVISREMAELYWAGRDPVGGVIQFGETAVEVTGVVEDVKWRGLTETPTSYVFLPLSQHPDQAADGPLTLVVHTASPASEILPLLRAEFRALDPELSTSRLETMDDRLRGLLMPQRMGVLLLSLLGCLALLLAALGIYGVVSCTVAQHTREIGVRMALGARRASVVTLLLRGMAVPVAGGVAVGLAGSTALMRTVESFLFGVSPQDPLVLTAIGIFLAAVAFMATLVPAYRAARISPVEALRCE